MSKLTKLLQKIKTKAGITAIAATLVLTPSGVAFAHGNGGNDNRGNQARFANNNGNNHDKKDNRRNDDKKRNGQNNPNQPSCEERQNRATQQFNDFKTRTQQRVNGLNLYLANQQSFVTTNNLSIEKYDELNAKATEAQTNANNALTNAQAPTIDCNKSEKKDGEVIYRSIREMHKSTDKFEGRVQTLSHVIADKIVVS